MIIFTHLSLISVGSLPTTHDTEFWGARALPSLSGKGAYLQYNEHFYELTCNTSSCAWSIMKQRLAKPVYSAVMMYLPNDYTC